MDPLLVVTPTGTEVVAVPGLDGSKTSIVSPEVYPIPGFVGVIAVTIPTPVPCPQYPIPAEVTITLTIDPFSIL